MTIQNDLFLCACRRQAVERTPAWMMRQAGRYLAEYSAVRAKSDFITMCRTPELAAEVTRQPVDLVGVDAAIIFSDILVVPEAMGLPFTMVESEGQRFPSPVRTRADVEALRVTDPERSLRYALSEIYGAEKVERALQDALSFEAFGCEYIANILELRARPTTPPGALHLTRRQDLLDLELPPADLTPYESKS